MSGPLCHMIEPATTYLRNRCIIAKQLLEDINKDDDWINIIRKEFVRIKKTFLRLEDANEKWRIFLSQLTGNKFTTEQNVYDGMVYDGKYFVEYMEIARQIMNDIDIEIADI